VLKTIQLLGFIFKAAIGEPFTQVCAAKIASLGEKRIPTIRNEKMRSIGQY
jgi:hypothetical protein